MTATGRASGVMFWLFVVIMAALTVVFVALGSWQLARLAEKENLAALIAARIDGAPVALPPVAAWPALDPATLEYGPVTIEGSYLPDGTVLVFTSLASPRGRYSGAGYWVMTPLRTAGGGIVFINRGFVPQAAADQVPAPPDGMIEIAGIARVPEQVSAFTPAPDPARRIDWVRDPERLAAQTDLGDAPIAPLTIDLPSAGEGVLPQGGETVLSFSNNHLGYAITWFGFALITPLLLGLWIWRQLRPAAG